MVQIVTVQVSQQVAPTPSTLQRTGALLSQGATTLSQNTYSLLTQLSDLTPLLTPAKAITSLAWLSSVVTVTTAAPHGYPSGDVLEVTIAGAVPAGYNGTYAVTVTGASTFTYALASNPGAETVPGTYVPAGVAELTAMATSFFAMGLTASTYVLELGPGSTSRGITELGAYITASPQFFYNYLVPRGWADDSTYPAFLGTYTGTTAKTYFFTTVSLANYTAFTSGTLKDVFAVIENYPTGTWAANALTAATWSSGEATFTTTTAHGVAVGQWFQVSGMTPTGYNGWYQALAGTTGSTLVAALATNPGAESVLGTLDVSYYASTGVGATEFAAAQPYFAALAQKPSATNKVTPLSYTFLYGLTPFQTRGNAALLTTLKAAGVNWVGTGSEGGISNLVLMGGLTMDLRQWQYWYAVDWTAINLDLNLSNAIINGSNDKVNPLYYNQAGIDRLQKVAANTFASGITFGMINGTVAQTALDSQDFDDALNAGTFTGLAVVNAVPIVPYLTASPGDYKIGQYDGLSGLIVPQLGFEAILFNLVVSDFVVQ